METIRIDVHAAVKDQFLGFEYGGECPVRVECRVSLRQVGRVALRVPI